MAAPIVSSCGVALKDAKASVSKMGLPVLGGFAGSAAGDRDPVAQYAKIAMASATTDRRAMVTQGSREH
jgi:hypothetical protein